MAMYAILWMSSEVWDAAEGKGPNWRRGEFGVSSTPLAVIIQCQNLMSPNCSCCQRSAVKLNACRPDAESGFTSAQCGSCCIVLGVTHVNSCHPRSLNLAIRRLSPKRSRRFEQSKKKNNKIERLAFGSECWNTLLSRLFILNLN